MCLPIPSFSSGMQAVFSSSTVFPIMGPDGAIALNRAEIYREMDRLDVFDRQWCLRMVNLAFSAAKEAVKSQKGKK